MEDRRTYMERLKAQFKEWDKEIDTLKAKAEQTRDEKLKPKYYQFIKEISEKRAALQTRYKELDAVSDEAWDKMKVDLQKGWNEFRDIISKITSL